MESELRLVARVVRARHYSAVVTGRDPKALARLFDADPEAAVLQLLQVTGEPMSAIDVKKALQDAGVPKTDADKAWPTVQKRIKVNEHIVTEGPRYRWNRPLTELSPAEALDLLVKGGLSDSEKEALSEVIRGALTEAPAVESNDDSAVADDSGEEAARQRQEAIDAIRKLAELASEVEELIGNETDLPVMMRQVRAFVRRSGLDPVGQAGEETRFDRKKHTPIGGQIRDGAPVIVVRPGYIWKTQDEDVLLGKAVVED